MVEGEKMTEQHVTFTAAGLKLEGVLHLPQGDGPFPGVVVCHPHPLYGGEMHNNVVEAICQALNAASMVALRFNFRGVGRSEGKFADGIGEQEDAKAALEFLSAAEKVNPKEIGLAGYSFGTLVAAPVALQNDHVQALALVSPFLPPQYWEQLKGYLKPKLILSGSEDMFVSAHDVTKFAAQLSNPKQFAIIPGADHFWWGYERKIAEMASNFFSEALPR
jgi:alpha/beta superfamily hydrolase